MGYHATFNAAITLSKEIDAEEIAQKAEKTFYVLDAAIENITDKTFELWFGEYAPYYDTDICSFLAEIQPYTISGEISYIGDDSEFWRFIFDEKSGKWVKEEGSIAYDRCTRRTVEELIDPHQVLPDNVQPQDQTEPVTEDFIHYSGRIRIADMLNPNQIQALFSSVFDHALVLVYGQNDYNHTFEFSFIHEGVYSEKDVLSALEDIQAYTIMGEIVYRDRYDQHWRHVFDETTGLWIQQQGAIEYDVIGESISALLVGLNQEEQNKSCTHNVQER